jgi:tetratricopeptide (TPR) repeat protein
LVGCHWVRHDGPVSQSLARCRQLSHGGVAALERGHRDKAEQLLAEAVKACPVDPEARRHYAEALWQRNARLPAIAQLQEAIKLASDDARLHVRLAEMHLEMGDTAAALRSAQRAVELNPQLASAWAIRGRARQATGELREALTDYHRALVNAPDDRRVLGDLAALYQRQNRPDRALQVLHVLAETYPPNEEPQWLLAAMADIYSKLGRHDEALDSLLAALERGPPSAELYHALAQNYWDLGQATQAVAAAQQALVLEPNHLAAQNLLRQIQTARQACPNTPSHR